MIMHHIFSLLCLAIFVQVANAQKAFKTDAGKISFVSSKNADVAAVNNKVNITANSSGAISFDLLIRDFKFEMAEMEDHFNDKYMETDKYPNATFKGRIMDVKNISFSRPGSYKVKVQGDLTIHNVTRKILANGILRVDKIGVDLNAKFPINIEDYKIDTGLGGIIIGDKMNIEVSARCQ